MLKDIVTKTAKGTESLGERLAAFLKAGDVIALTGDLGAGKTTFTKGLAKGLGVGASECVNSPSFIIVKEYTGRINLYHFDLYRLGDLSDIEYIRPEEYMDRDAVLAIEWADKLAGLLPKEHLGVEIKIVDNKNRQFFFKAQGKRYDTIVRRYFQQ